MADFLTDEQLAMLEKGAPQSAPSFLSDAQLNALESGVDPQFADVTGGSSSLQPPPPLSQRFHDALTFGSMDSPYGTFNPLDALNSAMGVLKAPINAAYRGGARAMGLPVDDNATPEQGIGEIVHPTGGGYPATDLSGVIANAAGNVINPLAPLAEVAGPRTTDVSKGLTEKAAGMATDPSSILLAGGALPAAAHVAMQTGMAGGITTQGLEAVDEYKKNGISGKFLSNLANMGVDGLFMLSGHLSKKEMTDIEKSPEVKNIITPPPAVEDIDPAQIKMIDRITKGQDMEEIAKQRAATKAGNASDKEYARRVDKLADAQAREDIARQREMNKPPIELDPLFPEGEVPKENVKLLDKLQREQEKGDNEVRFAEAQKQVKALESGEEDISLDELEMDQPPSIKGSEMPVEEEGIKVSPEIQDAVEGFTPKTSIKNLQEKLGVGEDEAREVYWKTKKALSEEKSTGNFPIENLEQSSLRLSPEAEQHLPLETKIAAAENPHLQKLKRWLENTFPAAKNAAMRALPGNEEDISQTKLTSLDYDPRKLGGRSSGLMRSGETGEVFSKEGERGKVSINPWQTAREIAAQVREGKISPKDAPKAFAQKFIDIMTHENAHVGRASGSGVGKNTGHGKVNVNTGEYLEQDPSGYYDPDSAKRQFTFKTAMDAVKNDPARIDAMRGILSDVNAPDVKAMYESILKDANKMHDQIAINKSRMTAPPKETKAYSKSFYKDLLNKEEPVTNDMASSVPPTPKGGPRLGGHPPSSPKGQALQVVQSPSLAGKAWDYTKKGISAVRALTVGGDVSSPFRQSWIQTFAHPIEGAKNIKGMFNALSEKGYERISNEIRQNPYFKEAGDAKLALTKGLLENKPEEQFEGTKVIEDLLKKGHLGAVNLFSPTERAYTQYLNKTRMDSFQRGMELLEGKYGKRSVPEESKRTLAKWVNSSTGRGEFNSKNWEAASTALNQVLFSPRLLKSRIDVFNPMEWQRMAKEEPAVAKMAGTEIARSAAFVGSMVAAAAAAGAKVEKDPRSPDFGKIRIGNHSIDPWGGYQQYIRYAAQLVTQERKNAYGEIKKSAPGDTVANFVRSKLAPVPGFLWSAKTGKNMIGRRTSLTDPESYAQAFAPMTFRDIYEVGKTDPVLATALALPISLGMGVVSREPLPASKSVQDEYNRLMVPPPSDAQSVQLRNKPKIIDALSGKGKYESRPLNDKEFKEAKEEGDSMAFSEVEKYISSPSYKALSEDQKRVALNNLSRKLGSAKRKMASQMVMTSPPSP